jgi:hypothetical protein
MATPPNLLPAVAGFVAAPIAGVLASTFLCPMPAVAYPPGRPPPAVTSAQRRCARVTTGVLGGVAALSVLALSHPRAASGSFRSAAIGALVGSAIAGTVVLTRMPGFAPTSSTPVLPPPPPPPNVLSPPPVPPRAAPLPPAAVPPPPAPANAIGCTPRSTTLPDPSLNQARALLNLTIIRNDPSGQTLATTESIATMRRLADAIAYCGSDLGAWDLRDQYVQQLRTRADFYERNLPKPPPANT